MRNGMHLVAFAICSVSTSFGASPLIGNWTYDVEANRASEEKIIEDASVEGVAHALAFGTFKDFDIIITVEVIKVCAKASNDSRSIRITKLTDTFVEADDKRWRFELDDDALVFSVDGRKVRFKRITEGTSNRVAGGD